MKPVRTALLAVLALSAGALSGPAADESAACLDPATVDDSDILGAHDLIADPEFCLSRVSLRENGIDWRLLMLSNIATPGPLWAVPHDEEDEAFAAAIYGVKRFGGTAVFIENDENRLVGGLDPNHIFATTPDATRECPSADVPFPRYVEAFLVSWDREFPVIGLHSNWDGYAEDGGLGTISVNRHDEKMQPFPSESAEGRFADEDTVAMLVGTSPPESNAGARAAVDWFNDNGVHVIFRHVTDQNNGCTLADYLALNGLGGYINLEVERGDFDTHPAMIDRAMAFLQTVGFEATP